VPADLLDLERLVYLNAFLLDVGESVLGNRGGTCPPHWKVNENGGYAEMLDAENVFYNDLAPAAAAEAAAALGPQSLAMTQPLTRAAWHTVPSTYVIGDRDAGLPPWMRERFAARAGAVRWTDTSHSPFLSRPGDSHGCCARGWQPLVARACLKVPRSRTAGL
jgi:pimeloyl-ACP methyl ester carboxylesterase